MAQTPDTDLNEHVRRLYGELECAVMMEKMRYGQVVPKLTHELCGAPLWLVLTRSGQGASLDPSRQHGAQARKSVDRSQLHSRQEGLQIRGKRLTFAPFAARNSSTWSSW